jgi:outer membrane lipoprotein-sorting protein
VLTFSEIKLNGPIADDVFEFVIPKGVDVLEDRQN